MTTTAVAILDCPTSRPALTTVERRAAAGVATALAGFGAYGFVTHAPSTVGYLAVVSMLAVGLAAVRQHPLPDWLAGGLLLLAVGHLSGGLIQVGDSVLYNAHPAWHLFQYDHVFHATASAFGVAVLWTITSPDIRSRRLAIALSLLGAIGFGGLNELVEFGATLAHNGSHVGGYLNTGWDLVANTVGAVAGATLITTRTRS
jgi:hypothetical protein